MALARLGTAAWRLLTDVRFAVLLIALLAVSGLVGLLVRQFPVTASDDPARYAAELAAVERAWDGVTPLGLPVGPILVGVFDSLGLFSVFSTPWFLLLMTVLTIAIVCCTLDRTPRLWRTSKDARIAQPEAFFDAGREHRGRIMIDGDVVAPPTVQRAFRDRHFRRQWVAHEDGVTFVYGDRNQYMKLATLATHAGLVLFLLAGAVTVAAGFETVVFVGEGQTAPVQPIGTPGNLLVKNHEFAAPQRADGSFADFSTDLSVYRDGAEVARKTIRVNDPLRVDGFAFHQNTFGPAAELAIRDAAGELVWDGPLILADELLGRPQGFMTIPGAAVGLVAVLGSGADGAPQLIMQGLGPADGPEAAGGEGEEASAAGGEAVAGAEAAAGAETLFLVTVPLGVTTDPEVTAGHSISWQGIGSWSGMVIKNDPGQPIVWPAFGLLMVGLVLTFYFPRRRAWGRIEGDHVDLAYLADRYVDKDGEFTRLRDTVALAMRERSARGIDDSES